MEETTITHAGAIKEFFGTPERPITMAELRELITTAKKSYLELAVDAALALGKKLITSQT